MNPYFYFSILFALICCSAIHAQEQFQANIVVELDTTAGISSYPGFSDQMNVNSIPYKLAVIRLNRAVESEVEIIDEVWLPLPDSLASPSSDIADSLRVLNNTETSGRNTSYLRCYVHPFRKVDNTWEYLSSATVIFTAFDVTDVLLRDPLESELSQGDIYKIPVAREGFYKIDRAYITSLHGNAPNPNQVKVLAYPGGKLNEDGSKIEFDQLSELPTYFAGNTDSNFSNEEYFVLYAMGADRLEINDHSYSFNSNVYDSENFIFIKISDDLRTPISQGASELIEAPSPITTYDAVYHYETNDQNIMYDVSGFYGSGQNWYSKAIGASSKFTIGKLNLEKSTQSPVNIRCAGAARSSSSGTITLKFMDQQLKSRRSPSMSNLANYSGDCAHPWSLNHQFDPINGNGDLELEYLASSGNIWLDYCTVEFTNPLRYEENILGGFKFSAMASTLNDLNSYQLEESPRNSLVFRLATGNHFQRIMSLQRNDQNLRFTDKNDRKIYFYAVADLDKLENLTTGTKINNQNILSLNDAHLVIVHPEEFTEEALRLADHRRSHGGLNVANVSLSEIYNEFSGGRIDPTAIRNFSRYLFETNTNYNYLLLFGGATFDYQNKYNSIDKKAYVPTYETHNSIHGINSFPTDDYFGLLTDSEGSNINEGTLDVGIGRLPIHNNEQAVAIVDKLIEYDTDPNSFGDWRLYSSFLADDEDGNTHVNQADDISTKVQGLNDFKVIDKIYFDAYTQVSTSGGPRYPDAKDAVGNHLAEGRLTMCYLGHGSYRGLSQERVIVADDIPKWKNKNKYPLFVTATCSFSAFDDPSFYSAGEMTLQRANAGSIGLFTTTRAVYSHSNRILTENIYDILFERDDSGMNMLLGDVMRRAKNEYIVANSRRFSFLGDPSTRLAVPKYRVELEELNGVATMDSENLDTLRALSEVQLRGRIAGFDGLTKNDFNGVVVVTLMDKVRKYRTLGQDQRSFVKNFDLQNTILFKGQAEVNNGAWEILFTLPKDIDLSLGKGKIYFYAQSNNMDDAAGSFEDFVIGGINDDVELDLVAPIVDVFLNDTLFEYGGITNSDPKLLVRLYDDHGINVSTSSLGHTPYAILDDSERFELEKFYKTDINTTKSGSIVYPLSDLETGKHRIEVKAWDISNNSGTGYTEFLVIEDGASLIEKLGNYPNPFINSTTFSFEHNLGEFEGEIKIDIFNSIGTQVAEIRTDNFRSTGYKVDHIEWMGVDRNGNSLAKGVYFYRVSLVDYNLGTTIESKSQKLILLR